MSGECRTPHSRSCALQYIAAAEAEGTRRGVQATAARKAAEKARADAAKAERQLAAVAEELTAKEGEFKVISHTIDWKSECSKAIYFGALTLPWPQEDHC